MKIERYSKHYLHVVCDFGFQEMNWNAQKKKIQQKQCSYQKESRKSRMVMEVIL